MPKLKKTPLYVAVGGSIVAVDPDNGLDVWRAKLKSSSFIATVCPAGDRVFAGAGGELYCLDAATGEILWHNKLKGLGLGPVVFAANGDPAIAAVIRARQTAAVT